MTGFARNATDKNLRAWLRAGPVDRSVGDGLTFVAKEASAREGKASWILRYRYGGRQREKVIGRLPLEDIKPAHIDSVLTRIVKAGAPTVANDALRYLSRMFHFAVKRKWVDANPTYGFEACDARGIEPTRARWLSSEELAALACAMRRTLNFGRVNELSIWLLLDLCVRKMELLSARWSEFDFERRLWTLHPSRTKSMEAIRIPLADPVIEWLRELKVHATGSEYLFPARRLIHMKNGQPRKNRFPHISPDTLNLALRRLNLGDVEHFTVHDMRRTARSH
jgi:integrase